MSQASHLSRAGMARLSALCADGTRTRLYETLTAPVVLGPLPLPEAQERLAAYLLDPAAAPIDAAGLDEWVDGSLLVRRLAPGTALPLSDQLAAVVAAPRLVDGDKLSAATWARRYVPRADEAIAAACARLPREAAVATIARLADEPLAEESLLHLGLLQAGRALAWQPALVEDPTLQPLVDRLVGLLDRQSPKPLLQALVAALGPLAMAGTPTAELIRKQTLQVLREAIARLEPPRPADSFLAEMRGLDRTRKMADEDYYKSLPDRQLAEAAAAILGYALPAERGQFDELMALVLRERQEGNVFLPALLDGVVAAARGEALGTFVAGMLEGGSEAAQLFAVRLAGTMPLDGIAETLCTLLAEAALPVRVPACAAVMLLPPDRALAALGRALDDPEPEVVAAAARALAELGAVEPLRARTMPAQAAIGRTRLRAACARAALPDASPPVVAELVNALHGRVDAGADDLEEWPLAQALGHVLRSSAAGVAAVAQIAEHTPGALSLLTVALAAPDAGRATPPTSLPAAVMAPLKRVLMPRLAAGGDAALWAAAILCRWSTGDATLVEPMVQLAHASEGQAGAILSALSDLRVRSDALGELLAPFLESDEHLGATVMAAAVAGVVLPGPNRLWQKVRPLLRLGTVAGAAAYAALVNCVRAGETPA